MQDSYRDNVDGNTNADDEEEDAPQEDEVEDTNWQHAGAVFKYLLHQGGEIRLGTAIDSYTALSYLLKLDSSQGNQAYMWGTALIEIGSKNLCLVKDQNEMNQMNLTPVNQCKHP
jgi:hypothetical protein